MDDAGLEVPASDDFIRAIGVASGVGRAGDFSTAAEGPDVRVLAGGAFPFAAEGARSGAVDFAATHRGADGFVARAELVAEEARLLDAAAGFAGCRVIVATARGLPVALLVVPLAPEAGRNGGSALAAAIRELISCVSALVLPTAGVACRADAAVDFLVCLAEVLRVALLPAGLLPAAALRRLAAGAAFLALAAAFGLRPASARRAGVFSAPLRAVVAFEVTGLPARDGAAALALPRVGVVALGAAVGAAAVFRPEAADVVRVIDAGGGRPAEAAVGRLLLGGALLLGRLAMVTSERSGWLASNQFASCALRIAVQSVPFEQRSCSFGAELYGLCNKTALLASRWPDAALLRHGGEHMRTRFHAVVILAALAAGPALAQTTTTTPGGTSGTATTRTVPADTRSDDRNWGWLGLLGLVGLAPLLMRKDRQGNVHADTRH